MSLQFIRQLHYKRVPNYDGWWTHILNRALEPPIPSSTIKEQLSATTATKAPLAIPFQQIEQGPEKPSITPVSKLKTIVFLNDKAIELPEKPDPPENCCMSGCAHCVWDMYAEDIEEYAMKKSEIRNRFTSKGVPLPKELELGNKDDVMEEMDPAMKAFLDLEKKMKNM